MSAARTAFESDRWRDLTPTKRGHLLRRLGDLIGERAETLAQIETSDNGKLIREMRAQLDKIPEYYYFHGGLADKVMGSVIPPFEPGKPRVHATRAARGRRRDRALELPAATNHLQARSGAEAGNTVVIKPSEHASAGILELMPLIEEAGFPAGAVNVITGDGAAGHALASHPGVDKIAFTGGSSTGRSVGQAAIGHFARVTLELGGKSPQIVFPDADPVRVAAAASSPGSSPLQARPASLVRARSSTHRSTTRCVRT